MKKNIFIPMAVSIGILFGQMSFAATTATTVSTATCEAGGGTVKLGTCSGGTYNGLKITTASKPKDPGTVYDPLGPTHN